MVTPERRRIKTIEAAVADVIRETCDTVTLVLTTGTERPQYEAGQFVTVDPHQFEALQRFVLFFEELKGRKEPPRPYSLSSAPHEAQLAFTVKEERYVPGVMKYPPLLSPFLVREISGGKRLKVTGFAGAYTLNSKILAKTNHLVHISAGSGIVPNFSIIKGALVTHPEIQHTLLYSSRTWEEIIFRSQLEALSRTYPDQLKVVHTLTREKSLPPGCSNARLCHIGIDILNELIPPQRLCHFFVCGPASFLQSTVAALKELGVPADQISHESYGS